MSTSTKMALDQIGQKLKSARESQGLTLGDIYTRTKIPINHLQSIDNGNAEDLPEPVYVSGFIRRYADCVGLNGQQLSDEYKQHSTDGATNGNGRKRERPVMDTPIIMSAPSSRGGVRIDNSGPNVFKSMGVSIFWILAVMCLITFLFWWNSQNNQSQDASPILSLRDQPNRFNNVSPSGTTPSATDKSQAPPQPVQTDSRITLIASKHVWVEVKSVASGDSLFTGYLEAGDRRDFQDAQGLRVRAGNGGSLTVEHEGKSATFGLNGKVAEKAYMARVPVSPDGTVVDPNKTAAAATTGVAKPIVKKVVRRPVGDGLASERRPRRVESSSHTYIPGESLGGGRSSDPLRYTEGRLDTD